MKFKTLTRALVLSSSLIGLQAVAMETEEAPTTLRSTLIPEYTLTDQDKEWIRAIKEGIEAERQRDMQMEKKHNTLKETMLAAQGLEQETKQTAMIPEHIPTEQDKLWIRAIKEGKKAERGLNMKMKLELGPKKEEVNNILSYLKAVTSALDLEQEFRKLDEEGIKNMIRNKGL